MATIVLLPLQSDLPTFGGMSSLFVLFGVLALYVVLCRLKALEKTLCHPVFLTGYALVGLGLLMEVIQGSVDYAHITGFTQIRHYFLMFTGAAFLASLCRDRQALRSGLYGILLAGLWMSVFLLLTAYGHINLASSGDFREATNIRVATFRESSVKNNWNTMAFFASQGAVVALALGLIAKTRLQQYLFLATIACCTIGAFLPMSRSGVLVLVVAATVVLYVHGIMSTRVISAAVILVMIILFCVPKAVFSRFTITSEAEVTDGRTMLYKTVIAHLPEYILTGVGVSHFYGDWGMRVGADPIGGLFGTHNIFAEVTVYWGLLGLLALLTLVWQAYQCLPRRSRAEPLSLCLCGIAVTLLVYSFFTHNLENKEFAITLGLLAGSSRWIWPRALTSRNTTSRVGQTTGGREADVA
jgi:hypothetical protein